MQTQETFEIDHLVLQKKNIFGMTVDPVMRRLPLLSKDHIVLLDCVLDHFGSDQHLLLVVIVMTFWYVFNGTDLLFRTF